MAKQKTNRRFANQFRRFRPDLILCHVDMGNKVIRVSAPEDEDSGGVVGFGLSNKGNQITNQLRPEKIYGGATWDVRKQNGSLFAHLERVEDVIHDAVFLRPSTSRASMKSGERSTPKCQADLRSDLNVARTSDTNSAGCSHAAKCAPFGTLAVVDELAAHAFSARLFGA